MKKSVVSIIVAMGMGTAAFSMDNVQTIVVEYPTQKVTVQKTPESLFVWSKTPDYVINYEAFSADQYHFLNIVEKNENISSPSLGNVRNSQEQRLIWENPTLLRVRSDFTLNPFISTESYHVIHNNGYLIAGNAQTYVKSTFAFENHAAIKLNPSSPVPQQLQGENPSVGSILGLLANHLPPTQVYTTHQAVVNPGCSIASITVQPWGGTKRESFINGTITYGDSFMMDLSVSGTVLEFKPNQGFKFDLQGK